MMKPKVFVEPPRRRLRARVFGRNRSRLAAASTRSTVSGATSSRFAKTRDTVFELTPASRATSSSVARFCTVIGVLPSLECGQPSTGELNVHDRHFADITLEKEERPAQISQVSLLYGDKDY